MIFPEMMELRKLKTKDPQLVILGAERDGNKVIAPGFISFEALRKGRRFWWNGWKFELLQGLEGKKAKVFPVNSDIPIELEIIHGPK